MNIDNFELNEEGNYSITKPHESLQIVTIMASIIGNLKDKIITDGTACMGGDTIRFIKYFKHINAVECNETNFKLLIKNCNKYYDIENIYDNFSIQFYHDDYLTIYNKLHQDIVYLDPPWSGPNYKSKESIILKLNDIELYKIVKLIKDSKIAKHLFIKAPSNVCFDKLECDSIHSITKYKNTESFKLIYFNLLK